MGPGGMTPLLLASAGGQEEMGISLLDKGADPNAKDENGATALHYAVLKGITALNGVRYANYVAHLFRPNQEGLVKALLAHKADPNVQLVKAPRLGGGSPPTAIGATPFLLAAASPDVKVMRLLASAGADPKIATKGKITPLMAAAGLARGQDFTDEDKAIASEAVRFAAELGNDVGAANEDGQTALLGAAGNGANEVVTFLAQKGAKLDVRDKYQQTPLSVATGIRLPWIPYGEEVDAVIAAGHVGLRRHAHLQSRHAAAAGRDGDVLAPIDRIGDGTTDRLRGKPRLPHHLAIVGIEGAQVTVEIAVEQKPAAG